MGMPNPPDSRDFRRAWIAEHAAAGEIDLLARDERVSFTQANSTPALMCVAGASGIRIRDVSGKDYLDFYGNNCHHVGYQNPAVIEKVKDQLERFCFVSRGLTSELSIELAEKLVAYYPDPASKALFVPGGSAAVETALMIAKAHTGRYRTVSFDDSYHGRSAGALSVGGSPRDHSPRLGPLMPGALHVPPFYAYAKHPRTTRKDVEESASRSLDGLRAIFNTEPGIAALIAEPIRNGPYVPPVRFWPAVRKLCDEHGTLLIFDDIPTGLGKTGRLFNCEHFGVMPDMTLLGKALGGTVAPLAAVIANSKLDTTGEMNLGYYTHEKNALSAAAGLATLSVLTKQNLPERASKLGVLVGERLARFQAAYPMVANVRHSGLMFAVDFDFPNSDGVSIARGAHYAMLRRGLLSMPPKGNTVSFSAPLIISQDELMKAFDIVEAVIDELSRKLI